MEFLIITIVWILALYGLFEIIKNVIYLCTYTKLKTEGIYVLIAVKNQEDKIEYFLRSFLFKIIYGKEDFLKNIIITDLNSKDDTKKILKKISEENECLRIINWKDCKELIDNINQK